MGKVEFTYYLIKAEDKGDVCIANLRFFNGSAVPSRESAIGWGFATTSIEVEAITSTDLIWAALR